MRTRRWGFSLWAGIGLIGSLSWAGWSQAQGPARPAVAPLEETPPSEGAKPIEVAPRVPPSPTLLTQQVMPIDLNTALRLAGVQNPDLLLARQRVVEAAAIRQLASVQILPTINFGMNYDSHTGVLQQSNGNILSINRNAVYVGAGANAVAAGTVNIPGIVLSGNIAEGIYAFLTARQLVAQREFASLATQNDTFLRVGLAYTELVRAQARRAIAVRVRDEAREVAELTAAYAQAGQGRKADADRAATELARRESNILEAEGRILIQAARLAQVLNVDPSVRLNASDEWAVPAPIVPGPLPLAEQIAIALLRRPELAERRAVIREAFLAFEGAKVLPFSPTILVGFSAGGFGGGSNLVRPVFGGFGGRTDVDAIAYWSLRNLGFGNAALINAAGARLQTTRFQEIAVLDRVRAEVAEANAKAQARFAQISTTESAVRSAMDGFREDLARTRGAVGLPIEVLDSLRLLAQSRSEYLDAIEDYNRSQFELFVAMGQPPADALARPVLAPGAAPATSVSAPVAPSANNGGDKPGPPSR